MKMKVKMGFSICMESMARVLLCGGLAGCSGGGKGVY